LFVHYRGVRLTVEIQQSFKEKATYEDFTERMESDFSIRSKIDAIKNRVVDFVRKFPIPGLEDL